MYKMNDAVSLKIIVICAHAVRVISDMQWPPSKLSVAMKDAGDCNDKQKYS